MTQSPIPAPPAHITIQTTPPARAGFPLGEPVCNACFSDLIPVDKPLPAWLVARVLTLQLKLDLLMTADEVFILGTLGDGIGFALTNDARRAVAVLKDELEKMTLLPLCQIGVKTTGGWHCVYPGPHVSMENLMDTSRLMAAHHKYADLVAARLNTLAALLKRPLPPAPLDPPAAK